MILFFHQLKNGWWKLLFTAMIDRGLDCSFRGWKYRVPPLTTRGMAVADGAQWKSKTPSSGFSQSLRAVGVTGKKRRSE